MFICIQNEWSTLNSICQTYDQIFTFNNYKHRSLIDKTGSINKLLIIAVKNKSSTY